MTDSYQAKDKEIQNPNHTKALCASLFNLRENGKLCDVTLISDGKSIRAHRVVLAACSEYFNAMFTSGLSETCKNEISMKGVDTKSLEVLVDYAYTGVFLVNEINVQTLLETADLLQFQSAKSLCCDFIKEQLSMENCLDIFQFADVYHCDDVLSLSQGLFNKNWKKIVDSESFSSINYSTFVKLISDDSLNIQEEGEVISMIAKWIEADEKNRKEKIFTLFKYVRWSYVDPVKLKEIKKHPLIASNRDLLPELDQVPASKPNNGSDDNNEVITLQPKNNTVLPHALNMRQSYASWLYILGGEQSFLMGMKSTEIFEFNTSTWSYGFSLNRPRTSFAAVAHGDKLFVIGGMCLGEKLKSVECYLEKEGRWKRLASLRKCQGDVKAAVIDDVVYVAGGSSGGEPACKYVERYDESNNQWNTVASMKSRRRRFGLCQFKGKLYAFGGFQDSLGDLKACEMYDPEANSWESIAPMKTNRCDLGVAVLSGHIYVAGGVNSYSGSISTAERYDPSSDQWTRIKSLSQARGGHSMASYFGRVIVIGGMNSYMQTCRDAEWYNEVEDKWVSLAYTNVPRFGSVAVVLPFSKPGTGPPPALKDKHEDSNKV